MFGINSNDRVGGNVQNAGMSGKHQYAIEPMDMAVQNVIRVSNHLSRIATVFFR